MNPPTSTPLVRRAQLRTRRSDVHARYVTTTASSSAVVLLHQSPLSSRRFHPLLPELGRWTDAYALDTPGYGGSTADHRPWSVGDYADALWAAVDELTTLPVVLVGRATGSVLAVEMAVRRPHQLRHFVAHGLPVYTDEECADRLAGFAPPYEVTADGSHLAWIWSRVTREYPWAPPELVSSLVADYLDAGSDFAAAYRAIWRHDLRGSLTALSDDLPITLVAGGQDRIGFMHERARNALPAARERILPDATDFIAEQEPDRFSALVRDVAEESGSP